MGLPTTMEPIPEDAVAKDELERKESQLPKESQTASDFIDEQLALEADAREVLPYKFDKCTNMLGPLRQEVYACLTCSPPPASEAQVYTPAGVCYSCSISCHGEHNLVELFNRRKFVCDCGTTRMATTPCTLRSDPSTGKRGAVAQSAAESNSYNQNFQNKFCVCAEEYDAEKEKGTMFQCIGLGTVETGGCGEDWYHPECLMGLSKDWLPLPVPEMKTDPPVEGATEDDHPLPPGFPKEDDFEAFVCYKCVRSNPWIKRYASTAGFLDPVFKNQSTPTIPQSNSDNAPVTKSQPSLKRKASDDDGDDDLPHRPASPMKRLKEDDADSGVETNHINTAPTKTDNSTPQHKHDKLPSAIPQGVFSLFMKEDFRDHLCHCPQCYVHLLPHPQLVEEEDTYEPSVSEEDNESGIGSGTHNTGGTGSLLERGEAALSAMDRVKAIEGVMVYNHLKDKVKAFLKPYAETGKPVAAEDIKAYFEKLRGDDAAIREAGARPLPGKDNEDEGGGGGSSGGNRKEQPGY